MKLWPGYVMKLRPEPGIPYKVRSDPGYIVKQCLGWWWIQYVIGTDILFYFAFNVPLSIDSGINSNYQLKMVCTLQEHK